MTFIGLKHRVGIGGGAFTASILATLYGCSSSSSSTPAPEAGADSSAQNEASTTPEASVSPESGTTPESGTGDAGMAPILLVKQTNLVADTAEIGGDAGAVFVDPNMQNPWGLAFSPTGTAWVSENSTDLLSVYPNPYTSEAFSSAVAPPGPADAGAMANPSGQIYNPDAKGSDGGVGAFKGDLFIACAESGIIAGWQGSDGHAAPPAKNTATTEVDESAKNSVFKGLAMLSTTTPELAVADFHNNGVWLYDGNYDPIAVPAGKWVDSTIPSGFAPFNVFVNGTNVYVAYAKQDAVAHDDSAGPGNGAVSVFGTDGTLLKSLIPTGGWLNSPWGMAVVPAGGWATLPAGALLVGNFGDGTIGAFDPNSGALLGWLGESAGAPLSIDGLWALTFWGVPGDAGMPLGLYFTAGPNDESDGLFGYLWTP